MQNKIFYVNKTRPVANVENRFIARTYFTIPYKIYKLTRKLYKRIIGEKKMLLIVISE